MSGRPGIPRVLFVNHAAELGGAELFLLDLARRYGGPCRVTLFADGPFRKRLDAAGVSVEVLGAARSLLGTTRSGGVLTGLIAAPAVLGLATRLAVRARAFDVVYANSQKALVVGALAARLANRPLVWHLHDLLVDEHFSLSRRRLAVGLANSFAAGVVCNSSATAAAFQDAGGRGYLVSVIPNGFAPAMFDAVDSLEAARVRAELSPDGAPLIGVFGRLAPWKGQHVLLDALVDLPEVRAVFVGEALFGEGAYGDELRAHADALGIADRVMFVGFRDDIPVFMRACDIVAHTSTAPEPFGRVIVEGMMAGRPVIATDGGGAREIVVDGQTGRLVRPGDSVALTAVVRDLLDHPVETDRLARRGRVAAHAQYSVDAVVKAVEQKLTALVDS